MVMKVDDATGERGGWTDQGMAARTVTGPLTADAAFLVGKCEEAPGGPKKITIGCRVEVELGVVKPQLDIHDAEWGRQRRHSVRGQG
jgi:hypothetical protein